MIDIDSTLLYAQRGHVISLSSSDFCANIILATDVPELALGSGIRDTQLGLRLRYEIRREFAPYFGVSWTRAWGKTGDASELAGENVDSVSLVVGARFWF